MKSSHSVRFCPDPRWSAALRGSGIVAVVLIVIGLAPACYHHRGDAKLPTKQVDETFVPLPGGLFRMGDRHGEPDEYPERTVEVAPFAVMRTEVSNEAYARCVGAGVCDETPFMSADGLDDDAFPVLGATWRDASTYCAWIGARLPTEAEWEYAARGGMAGQRYPWGPTFDAGRARCGEDGAGTPGPVAGSGRAQNEFGLFHVSGNAAEWVADYYSPTAYQSSETKNPTGPGSGQERVLRGGSYRDPKYLCRSSARAPKLPTESDNTVGFRCARGGRGGSSARPDKP